MEFFEILYVYVNSLKWVLLTACSIFYFRGEIKEILSRPFIFQHKDSILSLPNAQTGSKKEEGKEIKKFEVKDRDVNEIEKLIEQKESEIKDKDKQIFKLTIEKHFEYTYRLIFRSQINLLQNLQTITDGLPVLQIETHFQNTKKLFDVFKPWNLETYLKFLFDQNLIQRDNITGKIKLTNVGDLFLRYIVINGYNINSEKTF